MGNVITSNPALRAVDGKYLDSATGKIKDSLIPASAGGIQVATLPAASAAYIGTVYQYIGATDANYTHNYFYECVLDGSTYKWERKNVQPDIDTTIQRENLPSAGASELGHIYQYVGASTASLSNGHFYKCVEAEGVYSWSETEVQSHQSITGKADKVANATSGHIATLDSDGNLADGGKSVAELVDIIYGYLYEGAFYQDSAHTTLITASSGKQYIDMTTASAPKQYSWTGSAYVAMGGSEGMSSDQQLISGTALCDLDERVVSVENGWEKRNGEVFRSITTKEVVDNRTTPFTKWPLSAKQGYLIKLESDANEDTIAAALCVLDEWKTLPSVIAPSYKAYNTYSVGDYCTYQNTLYRCATAVSSPEFFDSNKWTATNVMAEVLSLISNNS